MRLKIPDMTNKFRERSRNNQAMHFNTAFDQRKGMYLHQISNDSASRGYLNDLPEKNNSQLYFNSQNSP